MPFIKGHKPWNQGISYQPKNMAGLAAGQKPGPDHPNWKGDDASYSAIHYFVRRIRGKARVCENCGFEGKCHWANISGEYKRDPADYKSLCPSCHLHFDNLIVIPRGGCISGV